MDLASEESERLPCLLTLLDLGASVNARDKHGEFTLCSLIEKYSFFHSLIHSFILKTDCFCLASKGKTPLLHALASSDGLTVHNTENIQLLLQRGTDCKTPFIPTLPSRPLLVIQIPSQTRSRSNHYIQKLVLVCIPVHLDAF